MTSSLLKMHNVGAHTIKKKMYILYNLCCNNKNTIYDIIQALISLLPCTQLCFESIASKPKKNVQYIFYIKSKEKDVTRRGQKMT